MGGRAGHVNSYILRSFKSAMVLSDKLNLNYLYTMDNQLINEFLENFEKGFKKG